MRMTLVVGLAPVQRGLSEAALACGLISLGLLGVGGFTNLLAVYAQSTAIVIISAAALPTATAGKASVKQPACLSDCSTMCLQAFQLGLLGQGS